MSNKFIVFSLCNTCEVHAGSFVSKTHKYVSKISLVPQFSLTHEITIYAAKNINQDDNIFINVKSRAAWCNIFIVDSLFSMKFLHRKAFIEFQSEKRIPVFEHSRIFTAAKHTISSSTYHFIPGSNHQFLFSFTSQFHFLVVTLYMKVKNNDVISISE